MPLHGPENFGTNADGARNKEYCHYCFQDGKFTEPDITMEQMIDKCVGIMQQLNMPEAQIEQTKNFIPTLKRWANQ